MRPGDSERDRLLALLDAAAHNRRTVTLWWRDDDAEDATPALETLLCLAASHRVPLGLAVVPRDATTALARRVADAPGVAVLQHGWSHAQHSPDVRKKAELGEHRPIEAILGELSAGRERLERLFGERFLPVLVPPWNRVGPAVRARRDEAGLPGLSAFGPCPEGERRTVNTHVDLIDWTVRTTGTRAAVFALVHREIEQRLRLRSDEPIGLLTHHLVHDEAGWRVIDELLVMLATHPAVAWPSAQALFAARRA